MVCLVWNYSRTRLNDAFLNGVFFERQCGIESLQLLGQFYDDDDETDTDRWGVSMLDCLLETKVSELYINLN